MNVLDFKEELRTKVLTVEYLPIGWDIMGRKTEAFQAPEPSTNLIPTNTIESIDINGHVPSGDKTYRQ